MALSNGEAIAGTIGDPCEYGCAGPCESWEHWRDRAEYLLEAGREWELRARYPDMASMPEGDPADHKPAQTRATDEQRQWVRDPIHTLGSAVDALLAEIIRSAHPAEDARLVIRELTRWQRAKYPEPAPTHDREEK